MIDEAKKESKTIHFASLMLKNSELEPKNQMFQKVELYSKVTLWKMIQALTQYLQSKVHLRHRWQLQKAMDVISRLPRCAGQAADAISAYTQVKMEGAHDVTENSQSQNVQTFRDTSTTTQVAQIIVQHGRPVVPLEWNLYSHPLAGFLWERQFEKVLLEHGWDKVSKLGMLICEQRKRTILVCVRGRHKISWKKQNIEPMWKVLMKPVDLGAPTSFLNMFIWSALNENATTSKDIEENYRNMFISEFPQDQLQKLPCLLGNPTQTSVHGSMIWKVMQRNVSSCIASWPIKTPSNCTKLQLHVLMTISSKKKY